MSSKSGTAKWDYRSCEYCAASLANDSRRRHYFETGSSRYVTLLDVSAVTACRTIAGTLSGIQTLALKRQASP
jgi:hypothetical protein